jgi:hypothetical protein
VHPTPFDVQDVLRTGKVRESARVGGFEGARSVLSLYARKVRDDTLLWRASPEDTLQAQCEFVGKLELDEKGKPELMARQIFNDDEKLYFARGLKLYADMGWPMSVKQIAALMQDAAQRKATRKGVRILLLFAQHSCVAPLICVRMAFVPVRKSVLQKKTCTRVVFLNTLYSLNSYSFLFEGHVDWKTGQAFLVSRSYVRGFLKEHPELKLFKSSNIDPLRSKKATASVILVARGVLHQTQFSRRVAKFLAGRSLGAAFNMCEHAR